MAHNASVPAVLTTHAVLVPVSVVMVQTVRVTRTSADVTQTAVLQTE